MVNQFMFRQYGNERTEKEKNEDAAPETQTE